MIREQGAGVAERKVEFVVRLLKYGMLLVMNGLSEALQ